MPDPMAINLGYGDFIIIEIALVHYVKELDLSMQSGQYISELLGKIEYNLANIKSKAEHQLGKPLDPSLGPNPQAGPK